MLVVEDCAFTEFERESFISAASDLGITCICDSVDSIINNYDADKLIYFYGTLAGYKLFRSYKHDNWYSVNTFSLFNLFKCFPKDSLLNQEPEYTKLTYDLIDAVAYGDCPPFFMRTPFGTKEVPGMVVDYDFYYFFQNHRDYDQYINQHIATFPVKNIGEEIRAVVINGDFVTASMYINDYGKVIDKPTEYKDVDRLKRIVSPPSDLGVFNYVIDFAYDRYEARWKVLEINDLWTAGLYGCDRKKIWSALYSA